LFEFGGGGGGASVDDVGDGYDDDDDQTDAGAGGDGSIRGETGEKDVDDIIGSGSTPSAHASPEQPSASVVRSTHTLYQATPPPAPVHGTRRRSGTVETDTSSYRSVLNFQYHYKNHKTVLSRSGDVKPVSTSVELAPAGRVASRPGGSRLVNPGGTSLSGLRRIRSSGDEDDDHRLGHDGNDDDDDDDDDEIDRS
jgi:hypothetical protein